MKRGVKMIEIRKLLTIDETINTSISDLPINIEEALIFDIETTGFSALTSQLYLIGVAYYKDSQWNLIQWMAETRDDERIILDRFFALAYEYKNLVHFNGDNFDVPYILKKCAYLDLDYNFLRLESFDLYKYFRKFKVFLPLERFSLKEIEKHLRIIRRDVYSGGELIQIYYNFARDKNKEDFDKLILHNEDDLIGTIKLLPAALLGVLLQESSLEVRNVKLTDTNHSNLVSNNFVFTPENPTLTITLQTSLVIPCTIKYEDSIISLDAQGETSTIAIQISCFKGVLRHFFENYKDYYYLPLEDTAIHKSVAHFVDSAHKKKAKKSNCYNKKEALYLPQTSLLYEPVFYKEYNDKISYFEYSDEFVQDKQMVLQYVLQILNIK